jgi:hypothetical protein
MATKTEKAPTTEQPKTTTAELPAVVPTTAITKYVTKYFDLANMKYPNPMSIVSMSVPDVKQRTRVNFEKGGVHFAYERVDGVVGAVSIKTPPLQVVHSGSLCGTGGQAKLKDNRFADKKFSLVCTDLELKHAEIYEANKALDIRANVAKFNAILEEFYSIFIQVKTENPTVHTKQYTKAKEFADIVAAATPGQSMDKYIQMLELQLKQQATKAFHKDSPEVEKALKVKGAYDYKFSGTPFFTPKKAEKLHPVDPEIKAIFDKGPGEGNPDFKYAEEVMNEHKKGKNFNRIRVTHIDKTKTYPPFGPFFGRGSTITADIEVQPYESGENDGLNLYIKGILVLHDEPYVPHDMETTSDFVAPVPSKKRDGEATTDDAGDAKKQKTDGEGPVTTDFSAVGGSKTETK